MYLFESVPCISKPISSGVLVLFDSLCPGLPLADVYQYVVLLWRDCREEALSVSGGNGDACSALCV